MAKSDSEDRKKKKQVATSLDWRDWDWVMKEAERLGSNESHIIRLAVIEKRKRSEKGE